MNRLELEARIRTEGYEPFGTFKDSILYRRDETRRLLTEELPDHNIRYIFYNIVNTNQEGGIAEGP